MTNAAKHLDPIFGIDNHVMLAPPAAQPTPLPTPYVGMVFDPFDYLPLIGATVLINGLLRAQAGTGGVALPSHLPTGGPFSLPLPSNESEVFMGSTTVAVDGDAQSHFGLMALSCQSIGMPAPFRKKGEPPKSLVLPTSTVLSIPSGPGVMIGGPPTISLVALGIRGAIAGLGKLGKGLRRLQRGTSRVGKAMRATTKQAQKAGDALASALKLGDKGRNAIDRAICTITGHPVDVASGKVFTDHVDFELPGAVPFKWERVWYSTSTYRGPLGHGWHHTYDAALYVADDVVLYRTPDGRLVSFSPLAVGEEEFDAAERLTLRRDSDGFRVIGRDHLTLEFGDIGRPNSEHVLRSITDPSCNAIRLHYDDRGRLLEIVDTASRQLRFTHDQSGRITAMTAQHPENSSRRFGVIQYSYDDRGNLSSAVDALSQPFRYEYLRHLLSRETNRNGLSFQFEYDGQDEGARCVRTWGDDRIYDHRLNYDLARDITTVTNSLGYKTQYQHENGLVRRTVDALGAIHRTEYDELNRRQREVDPLGHVTRFEYDARGNVLGIQEPDGAMLRLQWDGNDRLIKALDPNGGVWSWRYDDQGRLVERVDPLGHSTAYTYSGRKLVALTDPAGHTVHLDQDAQQNIRAVHTADAVVTRADYDALGRVTAMTDANGNVQRRSYDLLGRPTRLDDPDGNVRKLDYDGEGNLVHVSDAHFDVGFTYQGMGRLRSRSQAGTTVHFEYDTEERLIGVTNEHGHAYRFELSPTGEVLVEHGFDGIRRTYKRDRLGRVTALTRASRLVSVYRYDAAGRLTAVEHADGARETYRYRKDGELVEATNPTCSLLMERDPLGRMLRETCDGRWVASAYDPRGLRVRLTSSLGADQVIERNLRGDVVGVTHTSKVEPKAYAVGFGRDALGFEIERSLPGGVRARWQRDGMGRPTQLETSVRGRLLRMRAYRWDPGDRLRMIVDPQVGPIEYVHDAFGNLAWSQYSDGSRQLRMPDAVGNLFRSEGCTDRKYGPAGQLLEATDPTGLVSKYAYDAEGNLIEKARDDGERWQYRWGSDGMLREVERPDGGVVSFAYDALGRRVRKSFGRRTTCWLWDDGVPLHEWVQSDLDSEPQTIEPYADIEASLKLREALRGEATPRGPPELGTLESPITWIFEPESFSPMAKLIGRRMYSILTDHVGAPNLMLDASGSVAWSADLDVWGKLRNLEGDRGALPFRWPGQYEDVETGLYYNRFRYYDPEAGQYTSQDPIGLAGGRRLYGYVRDPLVLVDPRGLSCRITDTRVGPATHLAAFESGGSVVMTRAAFTKFVEGKPTMGRADGLFVTTKTKMDSILREANGDLTVVERRLGFDQGYFASGGGLVRADIDAPMAHNARLPAGLETGANEHFRYGGYTDGGIPEAVLDPVPTSQIKFSFL